MNSNYIDYIFDLKKRKFKGDFEGAYANCTNVWPSQNDLTTSKHKLVVSELLQNKGDIKILDVGCGYGVFANQLAGLGFNVYGCDVSKTAIEKAKVGLQNSAKFEFASLVDGLPYSDNDFDAVICFGVLQFLLKDMQKSLKELSRVVKNNGSVFLSASIPSNPIGSEYVSGYDDFLNYVKGFFAVKSSFLEFEQNDIVSDKVLSDVRDDLVLFCRKDLK